MNTTVTVSDGFTVSDNTVVFQQITVTSIVVQPNVDVLRKIISGWTTDKYEEAPEDAGIPGDDLMELIRKMLSGWSLSEYLEKEGISVSDTYLRRLINLIRTRFEAKEEGWSKARKQEMDNTL